MSNFFHLTGLLERRRTSHAASGLRWSCKGLAPGCLRVSYPMLWAQTGSQELRGALRVSARLPCEPDRAMATCGCLPASRDAKHNPSPRSRHPTQSPPFRQFPPGSVLKPRQETGQFSWHLNNPEASDERTCLRKAPPPLMSCLGTVPMDWVRPIPSTIAKGALRCLSSPVTHTTSAALQTLKSDQTRQMSRACCPRLPRLLLRSAPLSRAHAARRPWHLCPPKGPPPTCAGGEVSTNLSAGMR
ncbi:hypothetical protein QBC39DRAFT_92045 [Podospora conica]|nr:hypothetical protein QBC39DRAFT_92045 [Schizothecium conicum]